MKQAPTEKIRELVSRLNQWRYEYYTLNSPTVTDAVYDRQYEELERLEYSNGIRLSNSPTQTVGFKAVESLEKAYHSIPLLSLEKTKDIGGVMDFIGSKQVMFMHKLDGLTLKLEYDNGVLSRASTRGDGDVGEDVTHNAGAIEGIPAKIPYHRRLVIVGEVYITKPSFERLRDTLRDSSGNKYKNARNMAAGSIRCHDPGAIAGRGLVFSPFNVIEGLDEDAEISASKALKLRSLKRQGFSPCEHIPRYISLLAYEVKDMIARLRSSADEHGIPIDGIVVTYVGIQYSLSCGRTGHHYKDGIAFKFDDDLHETVLRGIEWAPSRSGELSPIALFDTVEIDGCEVSRASLHNLAFIKSMELMPGCRILVSKRNMIIPHVEENLDRGSFSESIIPSACPCCGSPVRIDTSGGSETLHCDNMGCSMQRLRQFVHFAWKKAMDIEGLSETTLEKFISKGWLNSYMDIYRLDRHAKEIVALDGFGERSWQRLWESIQRSRNTTFERYLVAMDIPMVGRTASRELGRYFNGDLYAFENAVYQRFDFTRLDGFGETLHSNIHEWFRKNDNYNLWKELKTMLSIENKDAKSTKGAPGGPFAGSTIVVTGKLAHFTRDTINAKIGSLGAIAGSSVSKNTDYLVCGEKAGSKLDKAKALGVTVLSEQQFLSMAAGA